MILNPTREQVALALFAFGQSITWDSSIHGGQFRGSGRKFKDFTSVTAQAMPYLIQMEPTESITQKTRMRSIRRFEFRWLIWGAPDPNDPADVGATLLNAIADAIEMAIGPDDEIEVQTLGGIVQHAFINGQIIKVPGDDDGQAVMVVPIQVLVP